MNRLKCGNKVYLLDADGFLLDTVAWDEDFAQTMAPQIGIHGKLSRKHWDILYSIRKTFQEHGQCPLVYETCRLNKLSISELQQLFPAGYLRGACRLAGITYKDGYQKLTTTSMLFLVDSDTSRYQKTYKIDAQGFLLNPAEWDEEYALLLSQQMRMPGGLQDKHWQIIYYLRMNYEQNNEVPTVYEICEDNMIDLQDLEHLFPDGYQRGAVRLAGLRVLQGG
ncbi:TusE/DsrC/DsvC family sulfur relay protein [candidate division CSSED10-310 bacterium]|uniref:TusE/DsrC/DsvC family sulfur relay protein n=1 Tax=candidate division CSSED10-310 bacterium TaxID=2855610 RepID=A0ABV6YT01_UNCC1